jgi:bacterial/archaeal transporter family-2 protein
LNLFIALIALASGAANPFQAATNAQLNKQSHSPLWAGIFIYASGLLGLLAAQVFVRQAFPGAALREVNWWAWLGGLISILSTMVGLTLTQKLGSGLFTGLSLTAAVVTSVLLDHFGIVGLKQHAASPGRLVGCALLVAGIWCVAKF